MDLMMADKQLLGTIAKHNLTVVEPSDASSVPSRSYEDVSAHLCTTDLTTDENRRVRWFVLEFIVPDRSCTEMLKSLRTSLGNVASRRVCLGIYGRDGDNVRVLAVVRKEDLARLASNEFLIFGTAPIKTSRLILKGKVQKCLLEFLMALSASFVRFSTELQLHAHGDKRHSIEELMQNTRHMTDQQLETLIGNCQLTPLKKRSPFQSDLLKVHPMLSKMRKARSTPDDVITVSNASRLVQKRSSFADDVFHLPVSVSDKTLLPADRPNPTLVDYIEQPNLHQRTSLLILGPSRVGKTELSLLLGFTLSVKYLGANAKVLKRDTVDCLRNDHDHLNEGTWLVLDDLDPTSSQVIYADSGILKSLLQVEKNSNTRARNADIRMGANVGKILTSNAADVETWIGHVVIGEEHRLAIRNRLTVLQIPAGRTLWAAPRPPSRAGSFMRPAMDNSAVEAFVNNVL